jgi:hypothetical protein
MERLKQRSRSTTRVVTSVLIAGLAVAATAGIAGGALKTKQAQVSVAPAETESVTATCKKGTRAVSGGFDAPALTDDSSHGSYVQTFASLRSSKREWRSTATNYFSVPEAGTLTDFAYCSDDLPRLKARSVSATIPEDDTQTLTAHCPRGGEAVSGGFAAETQAAGFEGGFPLESRRAGNRGWKVTAYSAGLAEGANVTAYAYCAKEKVRLKAKSATTSTSSGEENIAAKARCKKGEQAISGGFGAPADGNGGAYVEPFQSRRAGKRGWKAATAAYASGGSTVDWSVYVYCLEKEKN